MLYNLVLVIFMSSGLEQRFELAYKVSDDQCIDLRDQIRGQVDSLNNIEGTLYKGDVVDFIDAECVAQKNFY